MVTLVLFKALEIRGVEQVNIDRFFEYVYRMCGESKNYLFSECLEAAEDCIVLRPITIKEGYSERKKK